MEKNNIINIKDKKKDKLQDDFMDFVQEVGERLGTYIRSKLHFYYYIFTYSDSDFEFLAKIVGDSEESLESLLNIIGLDVLKYCNKKVSDFSADKYGSIQYLLDLEKDIDEYIFNHILSRIEDWYRETLNITK